MKRTKQPTRKVGDKYSGGSSSQPDWHEDGGLDLSALVAEFRAGGYDLANEVGHLQARECFEEILRRLPTMPYGDRQQLKEVWRRQPGRDADYGGPGNIVQLSSLVDGVSEAAWEKLRHQLVELCWGTNGLADRLQLACEQVSGIGWTVATRLVAICDPQRVIPNYSLHKTGPWAGKLDGLRLLIDEGLLDAEIRSRAENLLREHPSSTPSGRAVVASNDLLLEILHPHFADGESVDTWGMRTFLHWLAERYADDDEDLNDDDETNESDDGSERLAAALARAAEDLLCEVRFLDEVVGLLRDKGQVILYGPPGTGKTYFAQRLAQALVGPSQRYVSADGDDDAASSGAYSLVQFHPAYSYEDFFEGFRPQIDDDGQMTYELTPGPLVQLAERAQGHPDDLHVMVIDEINRANLPRVLGELLYLLEYRDEWTQTQYRPIYGFVLPSNLWFIGTMNTADRSIALIDAAMRRRFHFVPFFPDREPTAGLLRRWCEQNEPEQAWIADLLDDVNERLRGDLGGDYMLIGPSHFMKENLDEDDLRRIWEYNIEPLIEDQFFGRREVIDNYRFPEVWKRYGPDAAAPDAGPGTTGGPVDDNEPQADRDEGDESYGDG